MRGVREKKQWAPISTLRWSRKSLTWMTLMKSNIQTIIILTQASWATILMAKQNPAEFSKPLLFPPKMPR